MTLSMYQASVPVFLRTLAALSARPRQGGRARRPAQDRALRPAQHAPVPGHVSARAPGAAHRRFRQGQPAPAWPGVEVPKFADTEATFDELKARIAKTVDFVKSLKPAQIDGSEEPRDHDSHRRPAASVQGPALSPALRAAELLLPRHDGLRHPPPLRRGGRQARFHRADDVGENAGYHEQAPAGLSMVSRLIVRTASFPRRHGRAAVHTGGHGGLAGRVDLPPGRWPPGRLLMGAWLVRHDPGLLAERMAPLYQQGQKRWDKILIHCAALLWAAWLAFMPLDAVRFGWSHMPAWAPGPGRTRPPLHGLPRLSDVPGEHLRGAGGEDPEGARAQGRDHRSLPLCAPPHVCRSDVLLSRHALAAGILVRARPRRRS